MFVNYSGWNKSDGTFSCNVFIDENKQDYEIHFQGGRIAYQSSEFRVETRDWNYDGDVYSLFGAWFEFRDENGDMDGAEFFTPEDMVRAVIDAKEKQGQLYDNEIASIPGIEIPERKRFPKLDDSIRKTEARAMHMEVERNQRMNALGIRPSNEPWAK